MKTPSTLVLLLVLGFLLSACNTVSYQPSSVSGLMVQNPNIGYKGFTIVYPDNYVRCYPARVNPERSKQLPEPLSYAEFVNEYAHDVGYLAGITTKEVVVFHVEERAIAVAIASTVEELPSDKAEKGMQRLILDHFLQHIYQGRKNVTLRQLDIKPGKAVLRVNTDKGNYVHFCWTIPLVPRSLVVIQGVASKAQLEQLTRDMDSMVLSFRPKGS